jgi:WD40 repeat protein
VTTGLNLRKLRLNKGWPHDAAFAPAISRRFAGHADGIWDVAVGLWEDSTFRVTASADQSARVWSSDGQCVCIFQGHRGSVNAVTTDFAASAMPLVCTAAGDATAQLWQLPVGCRLYGGGHHQSTDESSTDTTVPAVVLHNALQTFRGHSSVVSSVACLRTGRETVVTGSWDRTVRLWDPESGEMVQVLAAHEAEITSVAAHESKPLVVSASQDTSFRVWDTRQVANAQSVFQG